MKKFLFLIPALALLAGCVPPFPMSGGSGVQCTSATTGTAQDLPAGGAYTYGPNTPSNGSNTYVDNDGNSIQTGSTMTTCAKDPSNVGTVANITNSSACGGCVQVYPHVTQQWDDYDIGSSPPTWGKTGNEGGTPISALNSLTASFNVGLLPSGSNAEAAFDVWPATNTGSSGTTDAMFWNDITASRGLGGATVVGSGNMTINGNPNAPIVVAHFGTEWIIASGTYSGGVFTPINITSGTVDLLNFFGVLRYVGAWNTSTTVSAINYGFEICQTATSADKFQMYSESEIAN